MQITHRSPKLERSQHVTVDVDIARQIRICEFDLVKTCDGAHRVPVFQPDAEARRTLTEALGCTSRKIHLKWHICFAKCMHDAIKPKSCSCVRRCVRSATLLPAGHFFRHAAAAS